jgi:hypothetical protein
MYLKHLGGYGQECDAAADGGCWRWGPFPKREDWYS